jgi:oxygen-dependent protoporphyrinogen oxidase
MIPGALGDTLKADNVKAVHTEDESVDSLLARRFGPEFARVFGSALVHGVYAADARELSVRAAFPSLWEAQARGGGSIVRGTLLGAIQGLWGQTADQKEEKDDYEVGNVPGLMEGVSVFSFKNGLETLTSAVLQALQSNPNVQLAPQSLLSSIQFDTASQTFKLGLASEGGKASFFTHVVSALPTPSLQTLLPSLQHLPTPPRSTVTLTNLIFPSRHDGAPLHPDGFGYLVPRPADGYSTANREGVLGVVFDSLSLAAQDRARGYTKLTVMQGGPHPRTDAHGSLEAIQAHLETTLGRKGGEPLPKPAFVRTWKHVDCIPAPQPGHLKHVKAMRDEVSAQFAGRLEVIGAGIAGVSVGDCVEMGRRVGRHWS